MPVLSHATILAPGEAAPALALTRRRHGAIPPVPFPRFVPAPGGPLLDSLPLRAGGRALAPIPARADRALPALLISRVVAVAVLLLPVSTAERVAPPGVDAGSARLAWS